MDGVLFPATYAPGENKIAFPGGYNIDPPGSTSGKNVCLIDSVGSQANRIEPLFKEEPYSALVPQIIVQAGAKEINLLDAGHRAGDAIARCSKLQQTFQDAFKSVLKGDARPLAKIAPTSLVFGVWDSRDTQAKLPRLVASTIRAYDVRKLTRSAVYIPPLDYAGFDVFSAEDRTKAEGNNKSPLAQRGFVHNPASGPPGGIIADGGIWREAMLALTALRTLTAGTHETLTLALRRYILGLALVAFTYRATGYLRQDCLLVLDPEPAKAHDYSEIYPDGQRQPYAVTHDIALAFAQAAAEAFGVGADQTKLFDKERAKQDLVGDEVKKGKKEKASK